MKSGKKQPRRLLIATDAWYPQVNGVVRTLDNVSKYLSELGHEVETLSHDGKNTWGLPSYPEIQIAFFRQSEIAARVDRFQPDSIHIATEGPIGLATRRYCIKNNLAFSTSFHTRFAEYAEVRLPVPGVAALATAFLRWFHGPSRAVLTPTEAVTNSLKTRGFRNLVTWTRGVDHQIFKEHKAEGEQQLQKPVMVYVGRLAVEKGIEEFVALDIPGTKVVIGDGPARAELEKRYPNVVFLGYLFGDELAKNISQGDVFVFPSKTDTFGLVMLEAMACGLPVAAFPVTGPIDVVEQGYSGWMDDDLACAVSNALQLRRQDAIEYAGRFTWKKTALMFLDNLCELKG